MSQGASSMSSSEILKTILQKDYPDPQTIPVPPSPSYQQPIPLVTLSKLIPGRYVSTTARIVYVKTVGTKTIFSVILEDSTFKVPSISHRYYLHMLPNSSKMSRIIPKVILEQFCK
jgi:hypothetical protein